MLVENYYPEEGLNGIDIDNIGNLEGSSWLMFIDEECENLIVVNEMVVNLLEILSKGRSRKFYSSE